MNLEEIALQVEKARHGDPEAFGALVNRFAGAVRSLCLLRSADPIRADDIAQQVFLTAWEKMPELRAGAPFWPWLERITRNHLLNEWRRVQRERGLKQRYTVAWLAKHECNDDQAEESEELLAQVNTLRQCLEQIPPNMRMMVKMRYEEDHTSDEIAAAMGRSADSVRQTLLRLREKLRECMQRRDRKVSHGPA